MSENIKWISYRIRGIDQWFPMKQTIDGKREFQVLLKTSIIRRVAKTLGNKISEPTLMGIYNAFYGGEIPVCQFCCKNLCWIDFDLAIDENGYVCLTPHPTETYKCNDEECRHNRSKLNPNSIEYVSKSYRVSYEEALEIIHTRNDSPFYFHPNKQSEEEYRKSQSRNREWYIKHFGDKADEKIKYRNDMLRQKCTRDGLIKNHGVDEADKICKSKAVTLEKMISKYGDEIGR